MLSSEDIQQLESQTWSRNITQALKLPKPLFQIAATAEDPLWPYDAPGAQDQLGCVSALAAGANEFGTANYCSEHTYQYSVCDPPRQAIATLPNLVRLRLRDCLQIQQVLTFNTGESHSTRDVCVLLLARVVPG